MGQSLLPYTTLSSSFSEVIVRSKLFPLSVFLPITIVPYYFSKVFFPGSGGDTFTALSPLLFVSSLFSLAPLADRLSYATDQLCLHTSQTYGGLINATLGNVSELLVAITGMREGMLRVVQLTTLGSILGNLLLVLGMSCVAGGVRRPIQYFTTVSGELAKISACFVQLHALIFTFTSN